MRASTFAILFSVGAFASLISGVSFYLIYLEAKGFSILRMSSLGVFFLVIVGLFSISLGVLILTTLAKMLLKGQVPSIYRKGVDICNG